MNAREQGGLIIAALCKLKREENGHWIVPSQSCSDRLYRVNLRSKTCTCQDHSDSGNKCKHMFAVEFMLKRELKRGKVEVSAKDLTFTKKPTYKQKWPAYNEAQMFEKRRFQALLFDLCRGIVEPPQPGTGRRRTRLADMVFASCLKVYTTISSRRFASDLADAHERGFLSQLMHSVSVCAYLESAAMTPVLERLIVQSSLPLRAVESSFASDSTGFSTSRFVRWYDEKYGVTRSGHDWVKAHAMCGVKTNIVTAVQIEDRDAADSPQFKALVETTAKSFEIQEVSADKAYLSRENLAAVDRLGAVAYVPFKSNSVAGEAGSLWEKMYLYYQFRREEFLRHYHKRNNAESTFSMVKAKFRDHVRSRTDVAMKNEVLAKFLCHNICVVIQSQCELGIEPIFWTGN